MISRPRRRASPQRPVTLYKWAENRPDRAVRLDPSAPFVYSYCTVIPSEDPRLAVGLVGLGHMGTAVAERLLAAGYPLVVHNRTPEKAEALAGAGAEVAASIGALAQQVDVVLTSLSDDEALAGVAASLARSARPGTVLVDLSTVSPGGSAQVAALLADAKVSYLRAPVSGNPSVVRAGNLGFIVSGSNDVLERVEPVLLAIGPTVRYVGEGEEARVVKLAVNLVIGGLAQLMAEALVLGESAGVARRELLEVMGNSAAGAPFVKYKTEPLLRDDYSATFTTALMEKDIDLILDAAEAGGVDLPLGRELKSLLRAAVEAGYGEDDFMALYLNLRHPNRRETAQGASR
jgi:3-hydroxyisobutyrate dehydrogenase-like beta-hydroxyacid dehydrogenase